MIDAQMFRDAMGRLGAAVNIVTTDGPHGRHGLTASAVCSVTDSPPTLLVCLNRTSGSYLHYSGNRAIGINVLASGHEELAMRFAKSSLVADERFAAGEWTTAETGAPLLSGAMVALDCTIDQIVEVGTHSVFFCLVRAVRFGDNAEGLIYHNRAFHRIPMAAGGG
jgi:flavin reductase